MNPDEPNVRYFFKEIMMNRSRKLVLPTRVFFIAGVITTTILMAIEALVIMPFTVTSSIPYLESGMFFLVFGVDFHLGRGIPVPAH